MGAPLLTDAPAEHCGLAVRMDVFDHGQAVIEICQNW